MDIDESNTEINPITYILAIIFLILGLAIIIIIVYVVVWQPTQPAPSCETDQNCSIGQICQRNSCVEITCTTNDDCENGICISPYCYSEQCLTGNDCPNGSACVNNVCVKTGNTCQNNTNCRNLTCLNNRCVQCQVNSDCPTGQGCFNNACRYPYPGETGTNLNFYPSIAQQNGNITAPPGYFCSRTVCGTGTDGLDNIPCGITGATGCPSTCSYCINSVCRCTAGQLYEPCSENTDCLSGLCSVTKLGKVCVPSGGLCAFNYSSTGCTGCCPFPSEPYCVSGKCSANSLGALCGNTGSPPDLCNNPSALTGVTGTITDNMGFFCVNGFCQQNPGLLNQQCTPGSCQFLNNNAFICTSVSTPTIMEMRCL
jgi:hypothetical protein